MILHQGIGPVIVPGDQRVKEAGNGSPGIPGGLGVHSPHAAAHSGQQYGAAAKQDGQQGKKNIDPIMLTICHQGDGGNQGQHRDAAQQQGIYIERGFQAVQLHNPPF